MSAALVAAVTGVLDLLEGHGPLSSLVVLYMLAVLPVAVVWGARLGAVVSLVSAAVFDFLFVPPRYSFLPHDSRQWIGLAAFVLTGVISSELAARSREHARELERIFDLSPDLLCVAGPDGYLERVNLALEQAFGHSRRQLLSRRFVELVHPEDREPARRMLDALSRGGEAVQFESRYASRDGSVRWLQWSLLSVPGHGLVYGAARDVTERRRAADELLAAQRLVEASRDDLRMLADEQAALRRVATLVARGVAPAEVFAAVADEVGRQFGADDAAVARFESDGAAILVAGRGPNLGQLPVGTRWELDDVVATTGVFRTGRAARVDEGDFRGAAGPAAAALRELGVRSMIASPVIVEGRLWGTLFVLTHRAPLPGDAEERMASFTELVATGVANADSRAELAASRARVVAAADEARRQIVRDLHDGAQQRLVQVVVTLKLARRAQGATSGPEVELVDEALEHAERATTELRDLAHGVLPAALSSGGLRAGIETLVSRVRLPVSVDVTAERLPPALEATAYFIVAEALTNAVKHAQAESARIAAVVDGGALRLEVRDDGIGGARTGGSSGLVGLGDRAAALNGTLRVESPPGAGTVIAATLPIPD
jgi:PAS domain S-box-containing protein